MRQSARPGTGEQRAATWDPGGNTRTISDISGARLTFTYDVRSGTVIQYPSGSRVTLTWCPSQKTASLATLSQFAAQVEHRTSANAAASAAGAQFLGHSESQRVLTVVAIGTVTVHSPGTGTGTFFPEIGKPRALPLSDDAQTDAAKMSQSPGCERLHRNIGGPVEVPALVG